MAKNSELSAKQKKMIAAMLTCKTIGDACAAINVGRTTLTRWLNTDIFISALRAAQNELITNASSQLIAAQENAIKTLRYLAEKVVNEGVRRAAANDILSYSLKYNEQLDVEQRLSALEKAVLNVSHK